MKIKVLSIIQSFPDNVVTLSKFRSFVEHPAYEYQVFCWESSPKAWKHWAADIPPKQRSKVLVSAASLIFKPAFLLEWLRFAAFLIQKPRLCWKHLRLQIPLIGFLRACYRLLDDYKILQAQPDILHFEFGTLATTRIYLKTLLQCKILVSFRGYDLNYYQLGQDHVFQPVWNQADGFHFLGQDLMERAKKRGFPGHPQIHFIPPAIDLQRFNPEPKPVTANGSVMQIISVSRLNWKKGLSFGLLAFAEYLQNGGLGVYHIVGHGPAKEELLFYVQELNLADKVVFHGKCTPDEVRALLNQSDIFLHPAVSEGFCNAALEAQAMQLPVICFAADGLSENVVHGSSGYVVPLWDWKTMTEHLHFLSKNAAKRYQMGENGRKHVAETFTLQKQSAAFDKLYKALMQIS